MKKHLLTKWLPLAVASALALLVGMAPPAQAAAFDSPVGAWDVTLSGKAKGNAQLLFNADGTIDGYAQLYTTAKPPDSNPRGPDEVTRTDTVTTTWHITNFLGSVGIDGRWGFDERGKLVGYMNEGSSVSTLTATNISTNSVSFSGVVSLGTKPHITLQGSDSLGKRTYSGIPDGPLVDLSGVYTGTGKRGGSKVVEFFTLTSRGGNNNTYDVTQGSSPGFTYSGVALLSGRKQLSIKTTSLGTNDYILTVVVGSVNTNKAKASLKGHFVKGSDTSGTNGNVSLNTFPSP